MCMLKFRKRSLVADKRSGRALNACAYSLIQLAKREYLKFQRNCVFIVYRLVIDANP